MKALFLSLLASAFLPAFAIAAEPVDYLRDIKPLLTKNCVACHGPDKQRASLRLDTAKSALGGGKTGPSVIPGKSADSLLMKAVNGKDKDVSEMPPEGKTKLTTQEIALLSAWIDGGAKHPADEAAAKPAVVASKHWSFQVPLHPEEPAVKNAEWCINPIDKFILARLEKENVKPSPAADRITLMRRLCLDLTGIPPAPTEIDDFLKDTKPDAYERLVDRLLASPHYGERWARHWLDYARYADSNGYAIDSPRSIWKYRDWVIDSINKDLPFDQFAIQQLAGDMLPNATIDNKIATGFHRNTMINEEGGVDKEQFRVESIVDRVNTVGTVFLGLTVGCCQCHDHKFDPIKQREYYQLFAFLNSMDEPNLQVQDKNRRVSTMVVAERKTPRSSFVMLGGDFTRKGATVTPGTPAVLPPLNVEKPTRLDLAKWIVDPKNPLTARVTINRMWQEHFGLGIVETDNDFGTQGITPTHPELLDWLATEFIAKKWSMKAMHKTLVMSATYRQSSNARPDLNVLDPRNRLLARQSRTRLDAEIVRDAALTASGLLNETIGGPSVYPPQPAGVFNFTQKQRDWKASTGPDRYRRGMYTFFWRAAPFPGLTVFDAPDASSTCTRLHRRSQHTASKPLTLLNDQAFFEFAQALAQRVLKENKNDEETLTLAFRLCMGRAPKERESAILMKLLQKQLVALKGCEKDAKAMTPADLQMTWT